MQTLTILTNELYKQSNSADRVKFILESDPQAALNVLNRCWPRRHDDEAACGGAHTSFKGLRQWTDLTWSTHEDNPEFSMTWPATTGFVEPLTEKNGLLSLKYDENFVFRAMDEQYQRLQGLGRENEQGEWARVGEIDYTGGSISLLHPSRLSPLRTVDVTRLTEGTSLPPLYKGQLIRLSDTAEGGWSVASGISYTPSRPKNFGMDGVTRVAVIRVNGELNVATTSEILAIARQANVNACVFLITDTSDLSHLSTLLEKEEACFGVTDICGLSKVADGLRGYFLRLKIGGHRIPIVFSGLDLNGITNNRPADAEKVLGEVMAQRHLLPAAWLANLCPSIPPDRLSDGQINVGEDVVVVTPGCDTKDVRHMLGQYMGHSLVRLPMMHMAVIAIKGDCGEPKVSILQNRVSIAVAKLIS